jgi:AcrR family transcriptional regulator
VFREHGLNAEMRMVAERAGVGVGTLYRNFPTRDDLVTAMAGEVADQIMAAVTVALTTDDPMDAIRGLVRGCLGIVERYGDMMQVWYEHQPAGHVERFHQMDPIASLATIVRRGIERGVFRADLDCELVATHIVCGFLPWVFQRLRASRSFDELVDGHVALLLHGMLAGPPAAPQ